MFFYHENMILYVTNAEKIWIFQSQRVHSFKWSVYFEQVVREWFTTRGHHTKSGILLGVQYQATSLPDSAILLSCYKGLYKCKLANLPHTFIHPAKILLISWGLHRPLWEALFSIVFWFQKKEFHSRIQLYQW